MSTLLTESSSLDTCPHLGRAHSAIPTVHCPALIGLAALCVYLSPWPRAQFFTFHEGFLSMLS